MMKGMKLGEMVFFTRRAGRTRRVDESLSLG